MSQRTKSDYEKLGRILADVYDAGYANKHRLFRISFLKGVFTGLGGAIGATVVVALLVWVLSLFNSVPLLNTITHQVQQALQSQTTK